MKSGYILNIILKNLQDKKPQSFDLVLLLDEMDTLNSFSLDTQSQLRRIFQRFTSAAAGIEYRF